MKQAISTIYPPPPHKKKKKKKKKKKNIQKTTTAHAKKKNAQKLNGFQRGSLAGRHPTYTPKPYKKNNTCKKKRTKIEWVSTGLSSRSPPHLHPQTIQKKNNTCKKKRTKIEWVSMGLSSRSPVPPPPPTESHTLFPRLPFFIFCYATSKTFEWHFPGGPMVARHCVLAGIGYVHVLYRHLQKNFNGSNSDGLFTWVE